MKQTEYVILLQRSFVLTEQPTPMFNCEELTGAYDIQNIINIYVVHLLV